MQNKIKFHIEEFGPRKSIQNPEPDYFVLTRGQRTPILQARRSRTNKPWRLPT
jgi:hypothetical protein